MEHAEQHPLEQAVADWVKSIPRWQRALWRCSELLDGLRRR